MRKLMSAMFLTAAIAAAQQTAPEPTFHSGTELVQISVIAQDKQSKHVADLRREKFKVFDNGAAQELRLFQAETENPAYRNAIDIKPILLSKVILSGPTA